jgi:DNA-binding GntR family transcriptional regulator
MSSSNLSHSQNADIDSEGIVARVYGQLVERVIAFDFKPGDRLNEGALARELGVSRTPIREALNRLTADGFLSHSLGQGFFRRRPEVSEIFNLYEFRQLIETGAVSIAVSRATSADLDSLDDFLKKSVALGPECPVDELVHVDELFHERIAAMTGNDEMLKALKNINRRIRFVRWIDMNNRRQWTQGEHRKILDAVRGGDSQLASSLMSEHIEHRREEIVTAVREWYGRIYVDETV